MHRDNEGWIPLIFVIAFTIISFFTIPKDDKRTTYEIKVDKQDVLLKPNKLYFYYDDKMNEEKWNDSIVPYNKLIFYNTTYNNIFNSSIDNTYSYGIRKN